jgi:type II secretory pathway predicted ATPase ExeA
VSDDDPATTTGRLYLMKHLEMDLDVETELSSFGLRVNPFQRSADPKFLWLGGARRETLSNLKSGILNNAGLVVLTGGVGTGKTTLTNALLRDLGDAVIVVRVSYPSLETLDFLQAIADECGIGGPAGSREALRHRFERFVEDAGSRNKRVLLVVDEAQSLSRELIQEIRHLASVGTDRSTCLNVLLVGQNELNAILSEPEDGALKERIGIRGTTAPLTEAEVRQYVQHRLKMAGAGRSLFTAGAIREVAAFSQGIPRQINVIGDLALMSGYRRSANTINAEIVRECAGRLGRPRRNGVKVRSRGAAAPVASAAGEERAGALTGAAPDGAGGPSDSQPLRGDGLETETVTSPAEAAPVASAAGEERAGAPRTGVAPDDGAGGPPDSRPPRGDGLETVRGWGQAAPVPDADEEGRGTARKIAQYALLFVLLLAMAGYLYHSGRSTDQRSSAGATTRESSDPPSEGGRLDTAVESFVQSAQARQPEPDTEVVRTRQPPIGAPPAAGVNTPSKAPPKVVASDEKREVTGRLPGPASITSIVPAERAESMDPGGIIDWLLNEYTPRRP